MNPISIPNLSRLKLYPLHCALALLVILLTIGNSHAGDKGTLNFNIPAQRLDDALNQFANITGWEVGFPGNMANNLQTPGLHGRFTPLQALAKLLQHSGLEYTLTGGHIVNLRPNADSSAATAPEDNYLLPVVKVTADNPKSDETTLPKVTVEADSAYDPEYYADPYNKDYVLPNATAGTKTDTPIMETPLNVQVISKQVLKDRQVIRLGDALKNVSGVTTTNIGSGGPNFFGGTEQPIFLRGFSSETFMRNGFRLQQGSASRELANVEAVEVLKGPAAILYGQVEPGGMVNIVTKQPLATPYYGFTQQFGSYDLYRSTFDASGPLTQNKDLLYRANLSYENSGSFRDFVGKEDVFFAPVLRWNISPKTQITFEMEYNHLHQGLDAQFVSLIPGFKMPISRNYGGYSPGTTETIFGGFNWSHQFNDDWTLKHRFSVNQTSFKGLSPFPLRAGTKAFLQNIFGGAIWNQPWSHCPAARMLGDNWLRVLARTIPRRPTWIWSAISIPSA